MGARRREAVALRGQGVEASRGPGPPAPAVGVPELAAPAAWTGPPAPAAGVPELAAPLRTEGALARCPCTPLQCEVDGIAPQGATPRHLGICKPSN